MSLLSTIVVNGKQFFGRSLCIRNNEVFIDGRRVNAEPQVKIDIVVQGNVEVLEVGSANSLEVNGSVGRLKAGAGDVKCGDVLGDIATGSGDVSCRNVAGNIHTASGDVECGDVSGSINTVSGDVNRH